MAKQEIKFEEVFTKEKNEAIKEFIAVQCAKQPKERQIVLSNSLVSLPDGITVEQLLSDN